MDLILRFEQIPSGCSGFSLNLKIIIMTSDKVNKEVLVAVYVTTKGALFFNMNEE